MNGSSTNWFHKTMRQLGALRPAAWIGARVLHHIDRYVFRLTDGQHTAVNILFGVPAVSVTTTGAKSGLPRSIPLTGIPDGGNFILIASNWGQKRHPGWYYNMLKNPLVQVSLNGSEYEFTAREVTGEERERYWARATAVHGGYEAYKRRVRERQIPVILLCPLSPNRNIHK